MDEPSALAFDFIIWFGWLGLFALSQRRFCRKYPGMRSVCRTMFFGTVAIAVLPGLWLLIVNHGSSHLLMLLNRCFGLGVFAQTFLRATLMLKWIAWLGIHRGAANPLDGVRHERILMAALMLMTQSVGLRRTAKPETPDPE